MAKAIDPVCQMEVDTTNPPGGQYQYEGTTYYFCAPGCRVAFSKDPAGYLSGEKSRPMGQPNEPKKVTFIGRLFGKK